MYFRSLMTAGGLALRMTCPLSFVKIFDKGDSTTSCSRRPRAHDKRYDEVILPAIKAAELEP